MRMHEHDALSVAVTGFQSQAWGEKPFDALAELGFEVRFCCDGESDSRGGIIETAITPTVILEADDFDDIVAAIRAAVSDIPIAIAFRPYIEGRHEEFSAEPTEPRLRVVGDTE